MEFDAPTESGIQIDTEAISRSLDRELSQRTKTEVSAVEAARWLAAAGLLADSSSRPGAPLRKLLRDGRIANAEQRPPHPHGRWFIRRAGA